MLFQVSVTCSPRNLLAKAKNNYEGTVPKVPRSDEKARLALMLAVLPACSKTSLGTNDVVPAPVPLAPPHVRDRSRTA